MTVPFSAPDSRPVGEKRVWVEDAAQQLYAAGQRRAKERAQHVQTLRIDRTDPLVLAVLERWDIEPADATTDDLCRAVSAVQAVVNCLGTVRASGGPQGGDHG